jgi:hypothetical protein
MQSMTLRVNHLSGFGARKTTAAAVTGALALLTGETDGFAVNAITYPATVAVIDTSTPANDLSNVDLDASNLLQSSASPKMVIFPSSPYVRWSPHNMFLNSGTPATQNVTLVTGFVYTVTVTGGGGGNITGSSGASGVATTGSPATFTATGTTGTFTLTGSLTTIQLNRGSVATPYLATTGAIRIGIPHTYDTAASKYAIWAEAAATNVLLRSQELSNAAWTTTGNTLTAAAATAPDGTTTGWNYASTSSFPFQPITSAADTYYSLSLFVKYVDVQWLVLSYSHVGGATDRVRVWFDIQNGVIGQHLTAGSGTYLSKNMIAIGNGWYWITMTGKSSNIDIAYAYRNVTADGVNTTTAGNTYVWGPNMELGTVAGSYIPTLGSSVTRPIDDITVATSTTPHSATAGTLYFDGKTAQAAADQVAWQLDDGTANERILFWRQADNDPTFSMVDGGADQVSEDAGTLTSSTRVQATFAWAANDVDISLNGAAPTGDATATLPTVTNLQIGCDHGTAAWNGYIYRLVYVPRQIETATSDLENWRYTA